MRPLEHKKIPQNDNLYQSGVSVNADGRTRTGTVSPPVDFESTTSANSITSAHLLNSFIHNHSRGMIMDED